MNFESLMNGNTSSYNIRDFLRLMPFPKSKGAALTTRQCACVYSGCLRHVRLSPSAAISCALVRDVCVVPEYFRQGRLGWYVRDRTSSKEFSATTEPWWGETSALSWRRLEAGRCTETSCVKVSKIAKTNIRLCELTYEEHRQEHQGNQVEGLGNRLEKDVSKYPEIGTI